MAYIRKRANGTYQAEIYVGRDANGEILKKFVTKDSKKECKAAAREIEQELEEGRFVHYKNVRFITWSKKWMELNKSRLSPSTYSLYLSYQKAHLDPFFGRYKIGQINEIHIKEFINEKLKTLSPSSVRRMMTALKVMLEDVLKQKSPTIGVKLPKEKKASVIVPTDEDIEKLHTHVLGKMDEPIILLAAWCGLRRGEIFGLKWDDIDWQKGYVRVDESLAINEDWMYEEKGPKSDNGIRSVVLPEYLLNLLDNLRKKQVVKLAKAKKTDSKQEDKPKKNNQRIFKMRPDSYSKRFRLRIVAKIEDFPEIHFHALRHYYLTWLYDNGIPDQYAAKSAGHNINVLKRIYQHLRLDREARIDSIIRARRTIPAEQNAEQKQEKQ